MKFNPKDSMFQKLNKETGEITPCDTSGLGEQTFDDNCRISETFYINPEGGEDIRVSTVFLYVKHGGMNFETMIFGGPHDQEQSRCATMKEAYQMHLDMCEEFCCDLVSRDDETKEFMEEIKRL